LADLESCATASNIERRDIFGVAEIFARRYAKVLALWIIEISEAIAIVVDAIKASFGVVFGFLERGFAIAPQEFAKRCGLGFLCAPFAGADLLKKPTRAGFALALGLCACSREASAFYAITLIF
jgi:hypothetical protein